MNVILINPRYRVGEEIFRGKRAALPLGILAVAGPLDASGYSVKIIDQRIETGWKKILLAEIKKRPLCVGVGCMTGPQIKFALEASRLVKQNSDVPVVWGGSHSSLLPEQTLQNENVDVVVQGEGEETMLEVVRALQEGRSLKGVSGTWYKENGRICANEKRPFIDLNRQPPLPYHLLRVDEYIEKRFGYRSLITFSSRGCSYNCAFCYNLIFSGKKWRSLTAEETIKRIRGLVSTYGIKGVILGDDNFFGDLTRAREILERIIEEKLDIILYKLDIRPDTLLSLDAGFLELIKNSGCLSLSVGIESGSERIRKLLGKNISNDQILIINRRLKALGIIPKYTFMIGVPTETLEDLRATIALNMKLIEDNPDMTKGLHIYTPLPGTELFDLAVQNGLEIPERLEDWTKFNYRTVNLPWLSRDRKLILEMLHFCTIFLEDNSFFNPEIDINPVYRMLAVLYRPFAKWRVKNFFHRFPVEIKIAEWLRLYPKQT